MLRLLAVAVLLAGGLAALVLQGAPAVPPMAPPDSAATVTARAVVRRLQEARHDEAAAPVFAVSAAELPALLAVAGKLLPGLRLDGGFADGRMRLDAALPLPGGLWLNGRVAVEPSAEGLRLSGLRLGALPLPAQAALGAALRLADAVSGGAGLRDLEGALRDVAIGAGGIEARLAMPLAERDGISRRLQGFVRRVAVPLDVPAIDAVLAEMHAAQKARRLPSEGSTLAYLRFTIEAASRGAAQRPAAEAAGHALIALAIACGARSLQALTGTEAASPAWTQAWYCGRTSLGERGDLRQHFTISAGLEAAASLRAAAPLGELKELFDSRPEGSGFSFDDIAANRAGIAFANRLMTSPPEAWPALLAALDGEAAVLPPLDGLPSGLSAEEFERRFGSVNSAAFAAVIAEIDRRIAALSWHRVPLAEAGALPGRG
jgi:hypothetical protein